MSREKIEVLLNERNEPRELALVVMLTVLLLATIL
jgi:hypothetical protein